MRARNEKSKFDVDFSFKNRAQIIEQAQSMGMADVIVIGGGITGAAVAREAAFRGLKTLLFEADDFASGTSSGSSKLLHGGVRYLEQYQFKLVYEAIQEREQLKSLYAPFVRDLDFVFPTYSHSFPPRWKLNLGLFLYDAFSGFRRMHKNLNRTRTLRAYEYLKPEFLSGACVYQDSFAEDFRLVIELIKSAYRLGTCTLSRMRVEQIISEETTTRVVVRDVLNSKNFSFQSRHVFNCAGPYSDEVRKFLNLPSVLELTQGVHFVVPRERLPISNAFVLPDNKLHRILFAIPWNQTTYLGTTDTPIKQVTDARAHKEDADYVLEIANRYFRTSLQRSDIVQSWAAVRPLIRPPANLPPSAISREHRIEEAPRGVFHLLGGKLTSHRVMAREALNFISEPRAEFENLPLHTEVWKKPNPSPLEQRLGFGAEKIQALQDELQLSSQALSRSGILEAEVVYSIRYEMCLSPLDFMRRRSSLYYEEPDEHMVQKLIPLFARELNWTKEEEKRALNEIKESLSWDKEGY